MNRIERSASFSTLSSGLLLAFSALALSGCGGGGGGGSSAAAAPNAAGGTSNAPVVAPPVTPPETSPAQTSVVNKAPKISGSAPAAINAGSSYSFVPAASDPDGDALTFSIQNKPEWASFVATTGKLSGTPGMGDVGTHSNIAISVTDGKVSTTLGKFSIAVTAISNGRVTLSWDAPTENTDGTPLTTLSGYKIRYGTSAGALTKTIDVGTAGISTYIVEDLSPATWYFTITAVTTTGLESAYSNIANKQI